jgi:hypothetical protein
LNSYLIFLPLKTDLRTGPRSRNGMAAHKKIRLEN